MTEAEFGVDRSVESDCPTSLSAATRIAQSLPSTSLVTAAAAASDAHPARLGHANTAQSLLVSATDTLRGTLGLSAVTTTRTIR